MTSISVGTIDVYCIDPGAGDWSVLTLQRAHDTRCPTAWETVHGHIETGESPEQAAVRHNYSDTTRALDVESDKLKPSVTRPATAMAYATMAKGMSSTPMTVTASAMQSTTTPGRMSA